MINGSFSIQTSYEHLNKEGQKEAAKRVVELTEIERYTKSNKWFKGKPAKEEITQAVEAYLMEIVIPCRHKYRWLHKIAKLSSK